jgi:SAM-dependent methyltransferase
VSDDHGRGEIVHRAPELSRVFDRIPEDYEARPGYPDHVFDVLVERCGLRPGAKVLEIGAGSGQATLPLLDHGARVTAIEPGVSLARRLTERTTGRAIEVMVSAFEDVELPHRSFDLVASATAFHWVDTTVGLAKCSQLLRDAGWLALWWTIWGDPDRPDPLRDALEPILRTKAPHLLEDDAGPRAYALDLRARMAAIDDLGTFGPVHHERWCWEGRHDPPTIRRIVATFAQWIALPEPLRTELLDDIERLARDELGGIVCRPYQTVLYSAARVGR